MPSAITHAAVAAAAGAAFAPRDIPPYFWPLSIACSILPDADVIAFSLGIPYHHFFGHRGFFHSPFFGLLMSLFLAAVLFGEAGIFSGRWFFFCIFFFLLWASHGILDAFTNGGRGIALLAPFDNTRYFFPWRPIQVAPIGIKPFWGPWGWSVMKSELLWVWLPSACIVLIATIIRAVIGRQ